MNNFDSRYRFDLYLRSLYYIGMGSQGTCYLDMKKGIVYKVFHGYFINEEETFDEDYILRFSKIENNTFIWPLDVIKVEGNIVGYTIKYVNADNLCNADPLLVDLNKFSTSIEKSYKDIRLLTDKNIILYDVMYNILYKDGKINVIDTLEYNIGKISLKKNIRAFDSEIKSFLVDNYFDNFVNNDKLLKEMYSVRSSATSLEFLTCFRNKLSEYIGEDVDRLSKAKKLIMKLDDPRYIRELNY